MHASDGDVIVVAVLPVHLNCVIDRLTLSSRRIHCGCYKFSISLTCTANLLASQLLDVAGTSCM